MYLNHSILNDICPLNEWPLFMRKIALQKKYLKHTDRFVVICFLSGNGIPYDLILHILKDRLRDKNAVNHVKTTINYIKSSEYDHKWSYYNVKENCILFFDGSIDYKSQKKQNTNFLKIAIWNRYCAMKKTTLEEQKKYFGEDSDICCRIENYVMGHTVIKTC